MRKNLITLGLVSAFGASTAMAVDLTNAKDTPDVFALDSVVATDIDATTDAINISTTVIDAAAVGVGVADGNQIFIRVDLDNGVFDGDINEATAFSVTNGTGTAVAQGGLEGDDFAIFDITSDGGIDQTDELSLTAPVGHVAAGAATVTVAAYETLADAINQNNTLASSSAAYATTGAGIADTATPINATAEVSTLFTRFDDLTLTAALGSVTFDTTDQVGGVDVFEPGGGNHTVADSLASATSDIVITGDFSFGTWEINNAANCAGATIEALVVADDEESASADDISGIEGTVGYVCVTVDGTEVINQGSYTYALEYDTVATAVFPAADGTGTVGSIAHNGTTVQVPYMTTFASYNQRFVMVNRGTTDADYTFTFTTEDGTTATAGTAATGTIPAGETLVVKATDIVTLTGNTRTAGTVVIVAPDANISVAAQQVNVADSGTDTVILN